MAEGERIDVASLLTIDVESELRKLTQAQLQGPWQLPAELVRRALREGATRVEVELGRSQLRVRSVGGAVPFEVLRELAALLDEGRKPERRHRALATLERRGALSLLGLAGLEPASLQILAPPNPSTRHAMGLEWRRGGAAQLQRFRPPGPEQAELILRGAKLDRTRAREWLSNVARYAPAPIYVDGRLLTGGFEDALSVRSIAAPLPGTLAIPREGEVARIFLLQDGLVSAHLSVTDAPCFEAALETRALPGLGAGASAASLRDAVAPLREAIVAAAVEHMIELGQNAPSLPDGDRGRLTQLLLFAARKRRDQAKTIARLPLFRGLEPDGRERWCDLLALRRGRDLLVALRPGGRPIPDAELDGAERGLLVQLRAQLERCEVAMCTGSGPVRRIGSGPDKLLLPRGSQTVRAAVRSVAKDPSWVYPALLALLDGRDFPDRARRRWRLDSWSPS